MNSFPDESRLEKLNEKVTVDGAKVLKPRPRTTLKKQVIEVPREWDIAPDAPSEPVSHHGFMKKFFLFSLLFFVLALGFVLYRFFGGTSQFSNKQIDVTITGNTFTAGGEDLPLQVRVSNNNPVMLESALLTLEYPKSDDPNSEKDHMSEDLDPIAPGDSQVKTFVIKLYGEQGTTREVKAKLEYRVKGSNAVFIKESSITITLSSSPITISVDAPDEATANQDITFKVKTLLNTASVASDTILKIEYPNGFKYIDATPKPTFAQNVWSLADLKQGEETEFEIRGTILGQDKEVRVFHTSVGTQSPTNKTNLSVTFGSVLHQIELAEPFVALDIYVDGHNGSEYAVGNNGSLEGEIQWKNNLPTRVDNLEVRLSFSGPAFQKDAVNPVQGFYNSINSEIVWDKNTVPAFASVDPGQSGTLSFAFTPKAQSSIMSGEPATLSLSASVKGLEPLEGNIVKNINAGSTMLIKFSSNLQLAVASLYRSGPFTNNGPLPPHAEQKTTYTIMWTVTNSTNAVSDGVVKTRLPQYVNFTGQKSPAGENITWDAATREVTWKLGTIKRNTGIGTDPRTAYFQVELLPSISQVGSVLPLVEESSLTGRDQFTNSSLSIIRGQVTTRLVSDSGFDQNESQVVR